MAAEFIIFTTTIIHAKRKEFELSLIDCCVADALDKMSNKVDYPYCLITQSAFAEMFDISRRSVIRSMQRLVDIGLIEKGAQGYRTTLKYSENFVGINRKKGDKLSQFDREKVTKVHKKSDKLSHAYMEEKYKKSKKVSLGHSLRSGEIQEPNTVVGTEAFLSEYERRKMQGWRGVYGPDLVCFSQGKIRLKLSSGIFVDFNDDLRKIVWKRPA